MSDSQGQTQTAALNERSLTGPEGLGNEPIRVPAQALLDFTTTFFTKLGWSATDAAGVAEILVESDLRSIESHGVPRLDMYLNMFHRGTARPNASFTVVRETPVTALVDGGGGLGLVVGRRAMELAIAKAKTAGIGLVTVTNSSHYGIAGFYAEMALPHDMLGLSMTNAAPIGVPAFGREHRLGSNPLAFAAPAKEELPFLLDMASTTVALGKVEIAVRQEKPVPLGWGFDATGQPSTNAREVLEARNLTMLGSSPVLSSPKGYGLAVMVDTLVGVLSGMGHSFRVTPSTAGHFFGAFRIDAFRDVDEFKADMDTMIRDLHSTPPVEGAERVYVAGEREYLARQENLRLGVPLHPKVVYRLKQIGQEFDIAWILKD